MTLVSLLLLHLSIGFAGFTIGRIGHIYGGHLTGLDHWIYGALIFIPGMVYTGMFIFLMFSFGTGLIISDLKDFINWKCWGPDEVEVLRFWHID